MKLLNFHSDKRFKRLLESMGAELVEMKSNVAWDGIDDDKLRELLKTGETEIDISEIEIEDGVLKYKGRKVIIYIRDQYKKYYDKGYKFHLSNCSTISKAIQSKRNSRYVISQRIDGQFKINLIEDDKVVKADLLEKLTVCRNCLTNLNYKGYTKMTYSEKTNVFQYFNLENYFQEFQKEDLKLFGFREESSAPVNVYNEDFSQRSLEYRRSKNFICSECNINLKEYPRFLHVHHSDGDKSNDSSHNLKVLCIECHAKQPEHSRLRFSPDYSNFLKIKSNIK